MRRAPLRLVALLALAGCPQLQSPDRRAREAIAAAAEGELRMPVGDAVLVVPPGRLQAASVTTAPGNGGRLRAFARISLEGRLDGVAVSYVGDERLAVVCAARCEVEGVAAPRLAALLEVLRARRRALAAGDRDALRALAVPEAHPHLARADLAASAARPAAGWFVRIDRDEALVVEASPDGERRQLVLAHRPEGWRLVSGLP